MLRDDVRGRLSRYSGNNLDVSPSRALMSGHNDAAKLPRYRARIWSIAPAARSSVVQCLRMTSADRIAGSTLSIVRLHEGVDWLRQASQQQDTVTTRLCTVDFPKSANQIESPRRSRLM